MEKSVEPQEKLLLVPLCQWHFYKPFPVSEHNLKAKVEELKSFKPCYGYEIKTYTEVEIDGKVLKSEPVPSKRVLFGKLYKRSDFVGKNGFEILVANMEDNGFDSVVVTRCLQYVYPLEKDEVIDVPMPTKGVFRGTITNQAGICAWFVFFNLDVGSQIACLKWMRK